MKNWIKTLIGIVSLIPVFAYAQEVFIYPAQGQSAEQQAKDEGECTAWAKQQTGYDPLNPPQMVVPQAADKSGGAAAKGMARGAIVGSVVGKATNLKRTESAAAGAIIGGVRSGKSAQAQQQAQNNQAQQQAQTELANQKNTFNRAYKTCLEGRGYTAK